MSKPKEPTPISSKEILKLYKKIKECNTKIEEIRGLCQHDYEVMRHIRVGEGYCFEEWEAVIHCKICDKYDYRPTK